MSSIPCSSSASSNSSLGKGLWESKIKEENSYPTLKWGLVTLFAGLGLLVISLIYHGDIVNNYDRMIESYKAIGIELIAISLGFIVYFIIIRFSSK